jgi:hypothetical protein
MGNVQKTAITDCNTPSSEPFRLHSNSTASEQKSDAVPLEEVEGTITWLQILLGPKILNTSEVYLIV